MPILGPEHDFAHPVEGDAAWSESYYFNGYDPGCDVGLFTRIGVRPNEGTIDVGLTLWLPGTRVAGIRGVREQHEMTDTALEVSGVRYERIEPLRSWHLTATGPADLGDLATGERGRADVEVDLRFEASTPAIGVDGQGRSDRSGGSAASTSASVGKGHLEQAGRWSGSVRCGSETWTLDPSRARGNRDKSWGPRRWGGPRWWRWFSINIDDGTHFGGISIGTEAGTLDRGWVHREGSVESIRSWGVSTELADDGVTHRVTHLRAVDKAGRTHELRGEVLRVLPLPHGTTLVNEGLTRWEYEGRTGYGIAEYLHQLDDQGRPVVPVV